MSRVKIIKLAREAGIFDGRGLNETMLKRFAALVAAAEREACAQACDLLVDSAEAEKARQRIVDARTANDEESELRAMRHELTVSTFNAGIRKCAAAIRARGQQ